MADWHVVHLTFEPELTDKKLEVLVRELEVADYDFPVKALTTKGLVETSGQHCVEGQWGHLWRSPMIGSAELIECLEIVRAVGHGWLVRDRNLPVSPDDRFAFGGGFPEITAAAEHQRKGNALSGAVYQAERVLISAARNEAPSEELNALAVALRERDTALKAH